MSDSIDQLLENQDFLDFFSELNDDYGQIVDPELIEAMQKNKQNG